MTIEKFVIAIAALTAGVLATAPQAHAAPMSITASVGGGPTRSNAQFVNFDNLPLGDAGGTSNGLSVAFAGGAVAAINTTANYTVPWLSHGNGALFGNPGDGPDTTPYLSTVLGTVTLIMPTPTTYFGLLWGSIDTFNSLAFYNGNTLVDRVGGGDLARRAVAVGSYGNIGPDGTLYVNFTSDVPFTTVVASSSGLAFEIDNVAYGADGSPAPVPEPFSLALLALGLLGLGYTEARRSTRSM